MDDFGLQPFDASSRSILMEIVEDRDGNRSTIITSQLIVTEGYEVISEQTFADAILDRVLHNAHQFELIVDTMRRKQTFRNFRNNLNKINFV